SLQRFCTKALGVIGGPPRRWYFDDAAVVESLLFGVECRILPDSNELGSADGIFPCCILNIDRASDTRHLAIWTRFAIATPGNIIDLFVRFTLVIEPALYDLVAVK